MAEQGEAQATVVRPVVADPGNVDDSRLFGVSVRGWLSILLVATVCGMSAAAREVKEPLYTLVGMALGFYFGKNRK